MITAQVDFDPPDELSDPPSLADRVFQPLALGSLPPLVAVGRALVRWQYVDDRLAEDTLYFERTGWNDGFMAKKDPEAAKRDAQARAAQTGPQLAILRRCTAYAAGIAALSTAGFPPQPSVSPAADPHPHSHSVQLPAAALSPAASKYQFE